MGLDNGIILRRAHYKPISWLEKIGVTWNAHRNIEFDGYYLCYWRRSYDIRKMILAHCSDTTTENLYILTSEALGAVCVKMWKYIWSKRSKYGFHTCWYLFKQLIKTCFIRIILHYDVAAEAYFYDSY